MNYGINSWFVFHRGIGPFIQTGDQKEEGVVGRPCLGIGVRGPTAISSPSVGVLFCLLKVRSVRDYLTSFFFHDPRGVCAFRISLQCSPAKIVGFLMANVHTSLNDLIFLIFFIFVGRRKSDPIPEPASGFKCQIPGGSATLPRGFHVGWAPRVFATFAQGSVGGGPTH